MNSPTATRLIASLICVAILTLFAIFVWPTRYRYEHTVFTAEAHQQVLIRIDRFTGEFSYPDSYSGEWKSLRPKVKEQESSATFTLPTPSRTPYQAKLPVQFQEIAPFVDGSARDSSDSREKCKLYMDGSVAIFDSNGKSLTDKDISASLSLAQMTCKNLYGEKGY